MKITELIEIRDMLDKYICMLEYGTADYRRAVTAWASVKVTIKYATEAIEVPVAT